MAQVMKFLLKKPEHLRSRQQPHLYRWQLPKPHLKKPQHLHPLPGDQITVDICIIKKKVLSRIQPDCVCKAPEILVDLLRSGIIISYH